MGFFNKIKEGLKKTRDAVIGQIDSMLKSFTKIDDELFEELEEPKKYVKSLKRELKKRVLKILMKFTDFLKKRFQIC